MALLKVGKPLTPKTIKEKLFYFSDAAHSLHLETKSFPEHKASGEFYEFLIGFRDGFLEQLMGYADERIGKIVVGELPEYSASAMKKLSQEVMEFAHSIMDWAEEKKYCNLDNMAQELSGQAAKFGYLLTLT